MSDIDGEVDVVGGIETPASGQEYAGDAALPPSALEVVPGVGAVVVGGDGLAEAARGAPLPTATLALASGGGGEGDIDAYVEVSGGDGRPE